MASGGSAPISPSQASSAAAPPPPPRPPSPPPPRGRVQLHFLGLAKPRPPVRLPPGIIVLGSGPRAQLPLRSPAIAAAHAALLCGASVTRVVNLTADRPVTVNGEVIRERDVTSGDVLGVGPFSFRLVETQPPGPAPPAAAAAAAQLQVTTPAGETRAAVPLRGAASLIGSAPHCDVTLPAEGLAPEHALVAEIDGRYWLRVLAPAPASARVGDREVATAELREGEAVQLGGVRLEYVAATPSAPANNGAEPGTIPRAMLRPVVGRRARPAPPPPPPLHEDAQAEAAAEGSTAAADAARSESEAIAPATTTTAPDRAPSSVGSIYGTMLLCLAAAAAVVWFTVAPEYVVRGSITFRNNAAAGGGGGGGGSPAEAQRAALVAQVQSRVLSEEVLRAAARRLGRGTNPANTNGQPPDVGSLARPADFARRVELAWSAAPADPKDASLVFTVRSRNPSEDVVRLGAWLGAVYDDATSASTRPTSADVRGRLLRSEIDDLKLDVAVRQREAAQARRDMAAVDAAAPTPMKLELIARRVANARAALDAGIEARVLAQVNLDRLLEASGGGAVREATTRPAATAPAAAANAAGSGDAIARARQALADALAREAALRADLDNATREAATAQAAAAQGAAVKRQLEAAEAALPGLERDLAGKEAELRRVQQQGNQTPRVQASPPDEPRVVRTDDPRPLWIAGATAFCAVSFGAWMVRSARRGAREA